MTTVAETTMVGNQPFKYLVYSRLPVYTLTYSSRVYTLIRILDLLAARATAGAL
jgi:hypothetical protein